MNCLEWKPDAVNIYLTGEANGSHRRLRNGEEGDGGKNCGDSRVVRTK